MVLYPPILSSLTIAVVADMVLCWFDEGNSQQLFPSWSCTPFISIYSLPVLLMLTITLFLSALISIPHSFALFVSPLANSCSWLLVPAVKSMTCANRRLHRKLSYTDENGALIVMKGFWHDVLQKNIEFYSPLTNCVRETFHNLVTPC